MSEELEKGLEQFILEFLETIKEGVNFVIDQAPSVVQELLNWALVSNIFGAVFWLMMLIACILFVRWAIKQLEDEKDWAVDYGSMSFPYFMSNMVAYILGAISFFSMIHCIYQVVFVLVAPKIYLIKYVSDYI